MITRKKHTTIRDIARLAGVSYQTVSLVINGKPGVSRETRQRIRQLMDDLDYRPNQAARMLSTSRSRNLELIMVDVAYAGHFARSAKNMAVAAREGGYSLFVSDSDSDELADALENAAARPVDGIVLYAPRLRIADNELLAMCQGVPLVRRDYVPGSKIAWVGFDQSYATRLAVEHLLALGHRQIAMAYPTTEIHNGYWRYNTWRNILLENGLEPGPACEGDYSMQSGYEATRQIIATGQPFTALVTGTDGMAMGALRALREHGLRVPADVSVVSFDNAELAAYTEPPLTTVEFKFARQDEMVVKYLIELIDHPSIELHQRILMSDLIIRESTRVLSPNG